jgi:uncharacterized protein (TIGR02186 family)
MSTPLRLILATALLITGLAPAAAERLVTSLSTHQVMISSNFTGTELVLFGSIERDAATVTRRGGYDLIVTVIGPREGMVTRRKSRFVGIWTNTQSYTFDRAPAYLAVLSNRPLDAIIPSPEIATRMEIGLRNFPVSQPNEMLPPVEFKDALIRLRKERGLYREETSAITFLTPTLFRAGITIPAESDLGSYEVDVKLFADGTNIARTSSALEIVKVGIEQFVANSARDHALLYGLATTLMALLTGWFASIVFRRD